jgi:hypothetical protein
VNIYAAGLALNDRSDQPRNTKIRCDGNYMQPRCEKEQCAQNFSGLAKIDLTTEHFVKKLGLEFRFLRIMIAANMQKLEAMKLARYIVQMFCSNVAWKSIFHKC